MPKPGLNGIDDNWIIDSIIGIGVAVGMIFLGSISSLFGAIGIPSIPASLAGDIGRFIIIVIAAPIFEELFFREIINNFFTDKLKFNILISIIVTSALFALFHLTAYGGSLVGASGAFVSVFIAGLVFAVIRHYTKSNAGNILAHATYNFWVISVASVVVA